uniref:Putative salivary lipocalin n=1 Tax=Ixodes ricinus TaxID=34613 RepID=A0A0K8RFJ2_IXORI
MGLVYAVFFACIAMASCLWKEWTTQMTIKNPENNPLLNSKLGSFQNAWKSLEMTTSNTYVLMFRTKIEDWSVKCVSARATITDKDNKTANYTIRYYHDERKSYTNVTVTVRALKQTDYLLENVIRGRFNETIPSADPTPQGSNNYIEFNDDDCTSSSSPFMDAAALERYHQNEDYLELEDPQLEMFGGYKRNDLDFYFVYSQPTCSVLRVGKECDLWLRHSELQAVLEAANKETEKEIENTNKNRKVCT